MIKNILNSFNNGLFRTLGRFIAYLLLGYILLSFFESNNIKLPQLNWLLNVHANTVSPSYYNNGFDYISGAKIYNWTSSTNYNELNNTQVYDSYNSDINYSTIFNGNVSNFGSNGISLNAYISNISLITNSYYNTTIYICYQNNVTINMSNVYVSNTYVDTFNHAVTYKKEILSNTIESSQFIESGDNTTNYCRAISFIYQPSKDGNVINTRLTSTGSLGTWYIVGQKTEYIGVAGGLTSSQVNNIINNSIANSNLATANDLQSVQSAVNGLSDDIQDMSQDIVDNQNANTQAQIDSQKVCKKENSWTNLNQLLNKYMDGLGEIHDSQSSNVTDYLKVVPNNTYVFSYINNDGLNADRVIAFFDSNKNFIGFTSYYANNQNVSININQNTYYVRITYAKSFSNMKLEAQICQNGNQAINDAINDDHVDSSIFDFGDLPVASDTPISDLILLPMNLINKLLSATNNSCSTYQLPFFNETTLNLPCIHIDDYLGSSLWNIIDLCIVFYLVYNLFMLFISVFDDITSLGDGFASLYTPRHAGHTRVSRANMEGLY